LFLTVRYVAKSEKAIRIINQLSLIRVSNKLVKAAGIFSTANHSAEAGVAVKHRARIDKRISI